MPSPRRKPLPGSIQEKFGRELHAYIEKLRSLRRDIEQDIRSLDVGAGKTLDIDQVIKRARAPDRRSSLSPSASQAAAAVDAT
jgi:hypothetical protein